MKNIKIFKVFLVLAFFTSSCSGFLDVNPADALTKDNAIETIEDLKTALNGAYSGLMGSGYYGCDFIARADVGGEDVQTSLTGKRTELFYKHAYRQANVPVGLWEIPYRVINRTNVILGVIESGKLADDKEKTLETAKGEALALRALCHFDLVITYGLPYTKNGGTTFGVPLALVEMAPDALPGRSSVADVYVKVIADLLEARKLLASKKEQTNGHFNLWAVEGLLSRVYLYMGNYDEAYKYAGNVIEKSPYKLLKREEYVAAWGEEYNSESVFDLHISDLSSGNRELLGYLIDTSGYAAVVTTKDFENLIKETPGDIRMELLKPAAAAGQFIIDKYPGRKGSTAVNNVRVVRLSELYLIAAESALKKGSKDQAAADKYYNAIVNRATGGSGNTPATLDLIYKERRKELVMEGHRLFDILRLGITVKREGGHHFLSKAVDLIAPNVDDYRVILPIPQDEIDVNENIIGQQNPNY